jgi:hypothetical protein
VDTRGVRELVCEEYTDVSSNRREIITTSFVAAALGALAIAKGIGTVGVGVRGARLVLLLRVFGRLRRPLGSAKRALSLPNICGFNKRGGESRDKRWQVRRIGRREREEN